MTTSDGARARECTPDALVRAAEERGITLSRRTLVEWVQQGLVAPPRRKGLGRGKGVAVDWPERQFRVALAVLDKRGPQARSPSTLADIPVWFWLRWGESYAPLIQVRRAMGTWIAKKETVAFPGARVNARAIVSQLAHPSADRSDKRQLVEELMLGAHRGRLDLDKIRRLAERVHDPNGSRVMQVLDLAPSPEAVIKAFFARRRALDMLKEDVLTDDEFRAVRLHYVASREGYLASASPSDLRRELDDVCLNLLTLIGLTVRVHEEGGQQVPVR